MSGIALEFNQLDIQPFSRQVRPNEQVRKGHAVQFRPSVRGWTSSSSIFESMRSSAHKSGWREKALDLIDDKLEKASISQAKYERAQREFMNSWQGPSSLLCTRYDPETDSHSKFFVDSPGNLPDPAVYEQKRRSVIALKGWHKRRSNEVIQRNLREKRATYAEQNQGLVQNVDRAFTRLATLPALQYPAFRASLNGHVDELKRPGSESAVGYAGLAAFQFKADDISAPVIVDRVTEAVKRMGLYGTVSHDEFQNARDRFIVRAGGGRLDLKRNNMQKKTIYDALKLHTRNYARNVFLKEEPCEGKKPASQLRIGQVKRWETDAVWDIYTTANALQNAAEDGNKKFAWFGGWMTHQWYGNKKFSAELAKLFHSPLIAKGGILEVTPQQVTDTSYRTSRPFIGFENTRPLMQLVSLPGLRKEVLHNIPLPMAAGEKQKYLDNRLESAIARAIEENIAAGRPAADYVIPEHITLSGLYHGDAPYPPLEET